MTFIAVRFVSRACLAALLANLFLPFNQVEAAAITAASPSLRDVQSAVGAARDGDTVMVPAGTVSWTSALDVTKGITIQGATTITGTRDNPTVTDATIITDEVPRGTHGHSAILQATISSGKTFRLSGFTFKGGEQGPIAQHGGIRLMGKSQAVRVDHCHFDGLRQNPNIGTSGQIYGVVDHCVLDLTVQGAESFAIQHDGWGGQNNGDGSWADDTYFGSEKFLFIEDCTFNKVRGGGLDCYAGGRYVARHNRFNNLGTQSHGSETTGRSRSARAIEVYNNTFNWTNGPAKAGELRGGCLLIHDNVWTGAALNKGITLTCYRGYYPFKFWGAASGANPLDSNDPKGIYFSGKAGPGSEDDTLVVPGARWTPGQWKGFTVTNTTQVFSRGTGTGQHPSSWITSNSNDTIKVKSDGHVDGPDTNFAPGDNFEIRKVLVALDQPGRGKGDLLRGRLPIGNATTGGVTWPRQALDPVYSWNNKRSDGSDVNLVAVEPTIQENRDFYNNKPKPGYQPYTYPHPLVTGGSSSPAGSKNSSE